MIYRETGQLVESYVDDRRMVPIREDRWIMAVVLIILAFVMPFVLSDYAFSAIFIPIMALSVASIGLNIATGYTGQLSLGTAGFMCIGAFTAFNLLYRIPWMNVWIAFFIAGLIVGLVGIVIGLPSLRVKGLYLIVATLIIQFFAYWFFNTFNYFLLYHASGHVEIPTWTYKVIPFQDQLEKMFNFDYDWSKYQGRYIVALIITVFMAWFAKNLVRSGTGREWLAVRDRDIAAGVLGIPVGRTKLTAFFISSFYCGVGGAMYSVLYLGTVDMMIYELDRSFYAMFMVIVGGLGSILGSFLGTMFVYLWPIVVTQIGDHLMGGALDTAFVENNSKIVIGTVIILLLIKEPMGFAGLWNTIKQKLRIWPFKA